MPEGPELHVIGKFINEVSDGRIYTGTVIKSVVSTKNPDIDWDEASYTISATSRGKEVMVTLTSVTDPDVKNAKTKTKAKPKQNGVDPPKEMKILFRMGMSGKFTFSKKSEIIKHSHLSFFSRDDDMVLSFTDYRRFGRWEVTDKWGKDRGPCIILEYELFRKNVLAKLEDRVFEKPICEVLLNQKYFNGVGNYLRAEILYKLGIPPFVSARSVLEPILAVEDVKIKKEDDVLTLCNVLPLEVIGLKNGLAYFYNSKDSPEGYNTFLNWLQCYSKEGMNNMVDHNGRTIWFTGPAGSLKPKESKSRGAKKRKNQDNKQNQPEANETVKVKKVKKEPQTTKKVKKESDEGKKSSRMTRHKLQEEKPVKPTKRGKKVKDSKPAAKTTKAIPTGNSRPRRSCRLSNGVS